MKRKKIKYSLQLLLKHCFTAVIPPLCEQRLGTENILLMEVIVSPPFFTVRVCVHVLCSSSLFFFFPSLSPVNTLCPQDILNSGLQRLFLLSWLLHPFLVGFQCTNQNPHKLLGTCEARNKVLISAHDFPAAFIASEYLNIPYVWVVGIFLPVFWQLCFYFSCLG